MCLLKTIINVIFNSHIICKFNGDQDNDSITYVLNFIYHHLISRSKTAKAERALSALAKEFTLAFTIFNEDDCVERVKTAADAID